MSDQELQLIVFSIFKIAIIVFLFFHVVLVFFVYRQLASMKRVVKTKARGCIVLFSLIHFFFVLGIFIFAIFIPI